MRESQRPMGKEGVKEPRTSVTGLVRPRGPQTKHKQTSAAAGGGLTRTLRCNAAVRVPHTPLRRAARLALIIWCVGRARRRLFVESRSFLREKKRKRSLSQTVKNIHRITQK